MMRFEIVAKYRDKGIELPVRPTALSAGYDLAAAEDFVVPSRKVGMVPTGLKVLLHCNEFLAIYIRSSVAVKHPVMLANNVGIIDADYYDNPGNEGHIHIPLLNYADVPFEIKKGDRIAQGIVQKFFVAETDAYGVGPERTGGFGSTDEKEKG